MKIYPYSINFEIGDLVEVIIWSNGHYRNCVGLINGIKPNINDNDGNNPFIQILFPGLKRINVREWIKIDLLQLNNGFNPILQNHIKVKK